MPKPATIRDVAMRAGVSLATVSRALEGSSLVNEETKRRVVAVAEELDFAPSQSARRLSLGKTQTITVVVPSSAADRLPTASAASTRALPTASSTSSSTTSSPSRSETNTSRHCRFASVRMVSSSCRCHHPTRICSDSSDRMCRSSSSTRTRTRRPSSRPGRRCGGGVLATEHLLELGHLRIGFVGDAFDNPYGFTSSRDRFAGFERALARAGVDGRPSRAGAHGRYEARDLASRMLSLPDRPTAIFAASDTQAWACLPQRRTWAFTCPMTCLSSATTTSKPATSLDSRPSVSTSSSGASGGPALDV